MASKGFDKTVAKYVNQAVSNSKKGKDAPEKKSKSGLKVKGPAEEKKLTTVQSTYNKHLRDCKSFLEAVGYSIRPFDGDKRLSVIDDPFGKLPVIMPLWSESVARIVNGFGSFENFGLEALSRVTSLVKNTQTGPERRCFDFDTKSPLRLRDWIVDNVKDPFWKDIESMQKIGPARGTDVTRFVDGIIDYYRPSKTYNPDREILAQAINAAVDEILDASSRSDGSSGEISCLPILPDGWSVDELCALPDDEFMDKIADFQHDKSCGFGNTRLDKYKGFPYAKTELKEVAEWKGYLKLAESIWNGTASKDIPVVVGSRRQASTVDESGEVVKEKWRSTFMGSLGEFIAGRCLWTPLLERMVDLPCYAGYRGNHVLGDIIRDFYEEVFTSGDDWFSGSLDPARYDKTLIRLMDEDIVWEGIERLSPGAEKYIRWCREYYCSCPLIGPGGIWFGKHGLFSGCLLTTFLGSFLNRVLFHVLKLTLKFGEALHMCMGDDTLIIAHCNGRRVSLPEIVEVYARYGLDVESDARKSAWFSSYDNQVPLNEVYSTFMGRYFRWNPGMDDHCVPVFALTRCLSSLIFPEKFSDPEELYRTLSAADPENRRVSLNIIRDLDGASLTGQIHMQYACTLMNIEHHPDVEWFISEVVDSLDSKFNTNFDWVTGDERDLALIKRNDAHVDYDLVELDGALALRSIQMILKYAATEIVCNDYVSRLLEIIKANKAKEKEARDVDSPKESALADLNKLSESALRGNVAQQLMNQL